MKIGSDMKNLVVDLFKLNTAKIQNFATDNSKINWFKEKLKSIEDLKPEEKDKILVKSDLIKQ